MLSQRRGNGMDSLMPVDAFGHETIKRPTHRNLVAERCLVFDDNVKGCVQKQIRQWDARTTMIALDETETLILAYFEPFLRRDVERIVAVHGRIPRAAGTE